MIAGVKYLPLKRFPDDRGTVWHMLKSTDEVFDKFGEIYFTSLYPKVIKAWHIHTKMDLNYACIAGMVRVVLYDGRAESSTAGDLEEYILGEDAYYLLHIPHGVTNGMQNLDDKVAMVANCATLIHDADEMLRQELAEIDFDWSHDLRG